MIMYYISYNGFNVNLIKWLEYSSTIIFLPERGTYVHVLSWSIWSIGQF